MSDKTEKVGDAVLPTLRNAEMAKSTLEVVSQIESALKTEHKQWQDLDASQCGIKDRVVKILTKTPAMSDQQVASAVYLMSVCRPPTEEEVQRAQKAFAETNDRPLSVLQLTRALVQGNEFSRGMSATNDRLLQTQKDLAVEPGTERGIGANSRFLTPDEFQKLIGDCAASVDKAVKTEEQFVDLTFLLALSRFPKTTESNQYVAYLKQSPDHESATQQVFSMLLNSEEFLLAR